MIVPIVLMVMMVCSVTIPFAFADLDILKKIEEDKAKNFQKKILNFDYDKIKNKNPGFKTIKVSDVKKKHIQNERVLPFKTIKSY